ncbi:MAG TPA: mechanosensitive ion channel domain-containing protein [Sphingobium sp.]|uniref:mechanosensitive ion channel family protein n=1 Tax=Sphingobium sp. TaxID=1912891 RepID=UPI002ED42147
MPSKAPAGTQPPLLDKPDIAVPDIQSPVKTVTDLVHWLHLHWLNIAIAIGVAVLIYFALSGLKSFGKRMARHHDQSAFAVVLGRAAARTSHLFMALVAARLVVRYASPPGWLHDIINFFFVIVTVYQVAIWAREVVLGLIERRADPAGGDTLANAMGLIRILVTVALFAIATVVVLDNIGVNVTGLVAGLGIGGIAIGLAAQGIFSDLFAALSIIFDRPFRQGEIITYDKTTARVEHIGLKSTRLRAVSGERKVISNANLLQKEITGLQHLERKRVTFPLGLVHHMPLEVAERVPDILKEIIEKEKLVFVQAGFIGFGPSTLDYQIDFDVPDPDHADYFMVRHRVGLAILRRFSEEGIEFAFPTQTSMTAGPDGRLVMPYPPSTSERDSAAERP